MNCPSDHVARAVSTAARAYRLQRHNLYSPGDRVKADTQKIRLFEAADDEDRYWSVVTVPPGKSCRHSIRFHNGDVGAYATARLDQHLAELRSHYEQLLAEYRDRVERGLLVHRQRARLTALKAGISSIDRERVIDRLADELRRQADIDNRPDQGLTVEQMLERGHTLPDVSKYVDDHPALLAVIADLKRRRREASQHKQRSPKDDTAFIALNIEYKLLRESVRRTLGMSIRELEDINKSPRSNPSITVPRQSPRKLTAHQEAALAPVVAHRARSGLEALISKKANWQTLCPSAKCSQWSEPGDTHCPHCGEWLPPPGQWKPLP